jgi:predicted ATPase/class 3 adenylate cyclase
MPFYTSDIETLTFLFTDIEGSTALLRRLGGDEYARVLGVHHRIIRAALMAHGGLEQGTQGDSFFATFTSPSACVAAAIAIQRSLGEYEWPHGEHVRVRMGIHTGEVAEASTGLVGYEVHRTARIAAVGYGGQVLLSSATAGLVEDSLSPAASLQSLGSHRLKDLGRPEVLFQLVAEGLPFDFAPLRSLDNPDLPNNLPTSLSPFIGRSVELAEVRGLVLESRLVTLTGSGGSGKTRLALQAAAELLDGSGEGVWFVELAAVSDPELVPATVLDALQIRQDGGGASMESLIHSLRDQDVLVVLDNCEHVVDVASKLVDQVGRHCPRVRILATSREPLGVDGEQVYRVRSLSVPAGEVTTKEDLAGFDAVDLFVARARLQDSTFTLEDSTAGLVATVCRRLDGIPLAIELAAARLSSMSITDLSRRLDQRFRLLTGGSRNALPRQQTLGAMVAWSYDLLTDPEREVLRRLSVFVNGFDLDAAEAVCAGGLVDSFDVAEILGLLVNKNLVGAERTSHALRYRLLETIRQYAAEQLLHVDGEERAREVREAHASYYLAYCERLAPALERGPTKALLIHQLDEDWDNIRASIESFADDPEGGVALLRLVVATYPYIDARFLGEVLEHIDRALREARDIPGSLRARALIKQVWLVETIEGTPESDAERMRRRAMAEEALELAEQLGEADLEFESLLCVGMAGIHNDDRQTSLDAAERALAIAQQKGDRLLIGQALAFRAVAKIPSDAYAAGEGLADLLAAIEHVSRDEDPVFLCRILQVRSLNGWESLEQLRESRFLIEETASLAEELGFVVMMVYAWGNLAFACLALGEVDLAEAKYRQAIRLARRIGLPWWQMGFGILTLSCCATARGDFVAAARLMGAADRLLDQIPEKSNFRWTPLERAARADNIAALESALGSDAYGVEFALGHKMSDTQVVNLALGRSRETA